MPEIKGERAKVTVYMPVALYKALEKEAKAEMLEPGNVSALVRRIVAEHLTDAQDA